MVCGGFGWCGSGDDGRSVVDGGGGGGRPPPDGADCDLTSLTAHTDRKTGNLNTEHPIDVVKRSVLPLQKSNL